MPNKVVSAKLDFVFLGKSHQRIRIVKKIAIGLWPQWTEFQRICRHHHAVLLNQHLSESIFPQIGSRNSASGQKATFMSMSLQRSSASDVCIKLDILLCSQTSNAHQR